MAVSGGVAVVEGWPLVEVRLNKVIAEENVSVSWKLGRVSLFLKKKKKCYCRVFVLYKGGKPSEENSRMQADDKRRLSF